MSEEGGNVAASTFARQVINKLPDIESKMLEGNAVELIIPRERIREVVTMFDASFEDAFPESMFGVDLGEGNFQLIYIFWSRTSQVLCQLRVSLVEPDLVVDTVSDIFSGLEWHERETNEMFGIDFTGHPDMRLLLLPDELKGRYPLRKSFETDRSRLAEDGISKPKPRPKPQPTEGGGEQ
ncbi:MAG: NADH-quinone oxidoreductase subunit C [Candidatus Thorarchaeota archaeon]